MSGYLAELASLQSKKAKHEARAVSVNLKGTEEEKINYQKEKDIFIQSENELIDKINKEIDELGSLFLRSASTDSPFVIDAPLDQQIIVDQMPLALPPAEVVSQALDVNLPQIPTEDLSIFSLLKESLISLKENIDLLSGSIRNILQNKNDHATRSSLPSPLNQSGKLNPEEQKILDNYNKIVAIYQKRVGTLRQVPKLKIAELGSDINLYEASTNSVIISQAKEAYNALASGDFTEKAVGRIIHELRHAQQELDNIELTTSTGNPEVDKMLSDFAQGSIDAAFEESVTKHNFQGNKDEFASFAFGKEIDAYATEITQSSAIAEELKSQSEPTPVISYSDIPLAGIDINSLIQNVNKDEAKAVVKEQIESLAKEISTQAPIVISSIEETANAFASAVSDAVVNREQILQEITDQATNKSREITEKIEQVRSQTESLIDQTKQKIDEESPLAADILGEVSESVATIATDVFFDPTNKQKQTQKKEYRNPNLPEGITQEGKQSKVKTDASDAFNAATKMVKNVAISLQQRTAFYQNYNKFVELYKKDIGNIRNIPKLIVTETGIDRYNATKNELTIAKTSEIYKELASGKFTESVLNQLLSHLREVEQNLEGIELKNTTGDAEKDKQILSEVEASLAPVKKKRPRIYQRHLSQSMDKKIVQDIYGDQMLQSMTQWDENQLKKTQFRVTTKRNYSKFVAHYLKTVGDISKIPEMIFKESGNNSYNPKTNQVEISKLSQAYQALQSGNFTKEAIKELINITRHAEQQIEKIGVYTTSGMGDDVDQKIALYAQSKAELVKAAKNGHISQKELIEVQKRCF